MKSKEVLLGYDTDLVAKQADPKIQWMRITEEVGEIHRTTNSTQRYYLKGRGN